VEKPLRSPEQWAAVWLRHSYQRSDEDFWAWEELTDAAYDDPERAWLVILTLVDQAEPDRIGYVGAGPLQHLIRAHDREFIDRIEAEAASHLPFRQALGEVWVNALLHPPDIVERLVRASSGAIEPYELDDDRAERKYLGDQDGA
jgi:uncharacterized protein DUF6869